MWLVGDTENGLGRLQLCEAHRSTALIWAAGRGELDLMDYLLVRTNCVDIDHESDVGQTALPRARLGR